LPLGKRIWPLRVFVAQPLVAVLLAPFHRPQDRTRQPIRSRVRAGHL